jgi:hypothetical protein
VVDFSLPFLVKFHITTDKNKEAPDNGIWHCTGLHAPYGNKHCTMEEE